MGGTELAQESSWTVVPSVCADLVTKCYACITHVCANPRTTRLDEDLLFAQGDCERFGIPSLMNERFDIVRACGSRDPA